MWPWEQKTLASVYFSKGFCAARQLWKDSLSRIKPTLGFRSGSNYKCWPMTEKVPNVSILIHSFSKKYVQKEYKFFWIQWKLPVFTPKIPNLQFWCLHTFAFSIIRFVNFTLKTNHFSTCKKYSEVTLAFWSRRRCRQT